MFRNYEIAGRTNVLFLSSCDLVCLDLRRNVPDKNSRTDLIASIFALIAASHIRLISTSLYRAIVGHCRVVMLSYLLEWAAYVRIWPCLINESCRANICCAVKVTWFDGCSKRIHEFVWLLQYSLWVMRVTWKELTNTLSYGFLIFILVLVRKSLLWKTTFDPASLARDRLGISCWSFIGNWCLSTLALFEFCLLDLVVYRRITLQTLLAQSAVSVFILVNNLIFSCFVWVIHSDCTLCSFLGGPLVLHKHRNNLADVALRVNISIWKSVDKLGGLISLNEVVLAIWVCLRGCAFFASRSRYAMAWILTCFVGLLHYVLPNHLNIGARLRQVVCFERFLLWAHRPSCQSCKFLWRDVCNLVKWVPEGCQLWSVV